MTIMAIARFAPIVTVTVIRYLVYMRKKTYFIPPYYYSINPTLVSWHIHNPPSSYQPCKQNSLTYLNSKKSSIKKPTQTFFLNMTRSATPSAPIPVGSSMVNLHIHNTGTSVSKRRPASAPTLWCWVWVFRLWSWWWRWRDRWIRPQQRPHPSRRADPPDPARYSTPPVWPKLNNSFKNSKKSQVYSVMVHCSCFKGTGIPCGTVWN